MVDDTTQHTRQAATTGSREELRTIAFRLREIQRLMAMRTEQENRRLEAEGHEPVTDPDLFRQQFGDD